MDAKSRLGILKDEALNKAASAAKAGDAAEVMQQGGLLQRIERLLRQLEGIEQEISGIEQPSTGHNPEDLPSLRFARNGSNDSRSTAKARGSSRRLEFLKSMPPAARPLELSNRAVFNAPSLGLRIGVAYAHEVTKNRWFLGLSDPRFDHAVLLCESREGLVSHFSLPKEFILRYKPALSKGQGDGAVKFNVLKRDGEFFLNIPRRGTVSIDLYRDNYFGLR